MRREMTYEGHEIKCKKVRCGSRGEYWIDARKRCNCYRAKRRKHNALAKVKDPQ